MSCPVMSGHVRSCPMFGRQRRQPPALAGPPLARLSHPSAPIRPRRAARDKEARKMSILAWIVLGLIAGIVAKALVPGRDPGGCLITIVIRLLRALLCGWPSTLLGFGRLPGLPAPRD